MNEGEFADLKKQVAAFVEESGEAYAEQIERSGELPPQLWGELRERGYLSLTAPAHYGGRGIGFSQYLDLLELFSMSHGALRMMVHVANGIWRAIDQFATEEQRDRFVRPVVAGDLRTAFTLTEPTGTGADLRSSVIRNGDTYLLTGEKQMISFGVDCDYWLLFARLSGTRGREGTVALMVDRHTPGVEVRRMAPTMGVHGVDTAHLVFDRARVPVANRLGEEGRGLEVALGGFLTPSRIAVAISCVGLARRAHELAVGHALRRETFGKPLAARQAIQFMIAENATDIEAARQLALHAARRWEADSPEAPSLSSMAKLNAVDALTRVTDKALQIHGGIGYWESHPMARIYRDARCQRFEEGTNETQKAVISRTIMESRQL
ncbi:acyl-CoA dehydrogenase family protein [Streptomyces afghaniensis]|uniref:acyl-CoA dehydrogenase family protein n=1 Tax=Streptomyces afghaniensis TaxID=66865 RepID=UPI002786736B|nr:acyl-CoA dehydrogenase family protein [Streptomyces afghaniensis]MDQ1017843.1 alkylation response protein AidB-like acyl-CoA dehydrogenase [Streptomyces afghaniensis]